MNFFNCFWHIFFLVVCQNGIFKLIRYAKFQVLIVNKRRPKIKTPTWDVNICQAGQLYIKEATER